MRQCPVCDAKIEESVTRCSECRSPLASREAGKAHPSNQRKTPPDPLTFLPSILATIVGVFVILVAKKSGLTFIVFSLSCAGLGLLVGAVFPVWLGRRNERSLNAILGLALFGAPALFFGWLLYESDSYQSDFDELHMAQVRLIRDRNSLDYRLSRSELSELEAWRQLENDLIPRAKGLYDRTVELGNKDLSTEHRRILTDRIRLYRLRWESLRLMADAFRWRDPSKFAMARTGWENAKDPPPQISVKIGLLGFLWAVFCLWIRRKIVSRILGRPRSAWKEYPLG